MDKQNLDCSENKAGDKSLSEILILEEAKKLKTVFLDNMSHELRTPITVILGYAGILYEEITDPDLKEMAEIILKSSNRLTESLNLLLDQSDVDSQRLKVELEQKNLKDILIETYNVYKPVVEDKGLDFILSADIERSVCNIDPKMINKVMSNLLNNAIKFTEQGSISIKLFSDKINEKPALAIEIKDTGIGIPEEKKSLIFEAFRQVSEGMNRLYQGTGLGLSVTKKFVEIMNGEISVDSKVNGGTTFLLKFPLID
jgi:signal transduction histidine kinase